MTAIAALAAGGALLVIAFDMIVSYTPCMSTRANKPISVTLGPFAEKVERRVKEGRYASASEVIRDGLRALDREDALLDEILKAKVAESLADTRPSVSIEGVDRSIGEWYEAAIKRGA
jgi:antitoxin ParD1/3/4